jgi:hypothetical protein
MAGRYRQPFSFLFFQSKEEKKKKKKKKKIMDPDIG